MKTLIAAAILGSLGGTCGNLGSHDAPVANDDPLDETVFIEEYNDGELMLTVGYDSLTAFGPVYTFSIRNGPGTVTIHELDDLVIDEDNATTVYVFGPLYVLLVRVSDIGLDEFTVTASGFDQDGNPATTGPHFFRLP